MNWVLLFFAAKKRSLARFPKIFDGTSNNTGILKITSTEMFLSVDFKIRRNELFSCHQQKRVEKCHPVLSF